MNLSKSLTQARSSQYPHRRGGTWEMHLGKSESESFEAMDGNQHIARASPGFLELGQTFQKSRRHVHGLLKEQTTINQNILVSGNNKKKKKAVTGTYLQRWWGTCVDGLQVSHELFDLQTRETVGDKWVSQVGEGVSGRPR